MNDNKAICLRLNQNKQFEFSFECVKERQIFEQVIEHLKVIFSTYD